MFVHSTDHLLHLGKVMSLKISLSCVSTRSTLGHKHRHIPFQAAACACPAFSHIGSGCFPRLHVGVVGVSASQSHFQYNSVPVWDI